MPSPGISLGPTARVHCKQCTNGRPDAAFAATAHQTMVSRTPVPPRIHSPAWLACIRTFQNHQHHGNCKENHRPGKKTTASAKKGCGNLPRPQPRRDRGACGAQARKAIRSTKPRWWPTLASQAGVEPKTPRPCWQRWKPPSWAPCTKGLRGVHLPGLLKIGLLQVPAKKRFGKDPSRAKALVPSQAGIGQDQDPRPEEAQGRDALNNAMFDRKNPMGCFFRAHQAACGCR